MSECIKITKGGKLMRTKWVYDKAVKKGSYVTKDVTDSAIRYLFDYCELDGDVTLKDIFLLLNTELDLFDGVLGNWCREIVTEGLTPNPEAYKPNSYDVDGIEYLELYKCLWSNETDKETYGTCRPDLHGIGYELKEDKMFSWGEVEWPKGSRIPWSLSFTPSNVIIDLPVKLAPDLKVYNDDHHAPVHKYGFELASYPGIGYTLGDILNGIIWELSFHGGPESREKASGELKASVAEIDKAKAEGRLDEVLIPAEQVFNGLDDPEEEE